jgi:hypothetical protein
MFCGRLDPVPSLAGRTPMTQAETLASARAGEPGAARLRSAAERGVGSDRPSWDVTSDAEPPSTGREVQQGAHAGVAGMADDELARILALVEPGARFDRAWTLEGGLSAQMVVLEAEGAGVAPRRLVLRRSNEASRHPTSLSIEDEYRLLLELRESGLPVPNPRLLDASGGILDEPYSVLDFIDGSPRLSTEHPVRTGRAFASQLRAIHAVDSSRRGFAGLPRRSAEVGQRLATVPKVLDETLGEGVMRDVLAGQRALAGRQDRGRGGLGRRRGRRSPRRCGHRPSRLDGRTGARWIDADQRSSSASTSPMILVVSCAGSGSPPSTSATSAAKSSTE